MNRTKRNDKSEKHYRELRWKHFFRLFITYVAPLIILTFFLDISINLYWMRAARFI